jgi:hypothetical protein
MIQYIKNSAETLIERITEATAMIRKRELKLQSQEANEFGIFEEILNFEKMKKVFDLNGKTVEKSLAASISNSSYSGI